MVPGSGVIQIAGRGALAAARRGAGRVAGGDQVPQRPAGTVRAHREDALIPLDQPTKLAAAIGEFAPTAGEKAQAIRPV